MNFIVKLALRHILTNKKQAFLIVCAIALGVLLIIFLPSLNYGFYEELLNKTINTSPHITVTRLKDDDQSVVLKKGPEGWELNRNNTQIKNKHLTAYHQLCEKILSLQGVTGASPYITGNGVLVNGDKTYNVEYNGIVYPDYNKVVDIDKDIVLGSFKKLNPDGIGMGEKLAKKLRVTLNDVITLSTEKGKRSVRVVAIYNSGFITKDASTVYVYLMTSQVLSGLKNQVDGIGVKIKSPGEADRIKDHISFMTHLEVKSWKDDNASLLSEIGSFEAMSAIINTTIMISVGTGVLGIMVIMVNNKRKQIGMLKAMGLIDYKVILLFCIEGLLLSIAGALAGTVLSVLCIDYFNTHPIELSDKYGITEMKGVYRPDVFIQAYILSILSGILAAFLPSYFAAKTDPVEVLKSQ